MVEIGEKYCYRDNKDYQAVVVGFDSKGIPLLESIIEAGLVEDKQGVIYRYNSDRWKFLPLVRTITKYAYVIKLGDVFYMDYNLFDSKDSAYNDAYNSENWNGNGTKDSVEIIPVTWTEKTE